MSKTTDRYSGVGVQPSTAPEAAIAWALLLKTLENNRDLSNEVAILKDQCAELKASVADVEKQVDAVNAAIATQTSHLLLGYIVNVMSDVNGGYVADCPTLHAVSEGDSFEEAMTNIQESMQVAIEGRKHFGRPVPPKDTEVTCQG